MSAKVLDIPKRYADGSAYFEEYVDDIVNSTQEWALTSVRNLNQAVLDILGPNYQLDNDGNANRATPLIDSMATLDENEIVTGDWTFQGTTVLTGLQINDTSSDHQYILAVNELAADRTITLPLLGGNDEFTFNAHTQTLTNKTLTGPTITTPLITFGNLNLYSGQKVILDADGDSDTFLFEDSEDDVQLNVGGSTNFAVSTSRILLGNVDVYIHENKYLYLDGGTTYGITKPTGQSYLQVKTGSDNFFRFSNGSSFSAINTASNSNAELGVSNDASYFLLRIDGSDNDNFKIIQYSGSEKERIESGLSGSNYFWNIQNTDTNGIASLGLVNDASYFVFKIDGSDNDFLKIIQSSSGDKERIESGLSGSNYFWNIKNTDTNGIASLGLVNDASYFVFKIDGADNDYLKLTNGSDTEIWEVLTNGELLLPDIDPPTSIYNMNRNSPIIGGFLISWGGASWSLIASYNVSGITSTSSTEFTITWDTNLPSNHCITMSHESTITLYKISIDTTSTTSTTFNTDGGGIFRGHVSILPS